MPIRKEEAVAEKKPVAPAKEAPKGGEKVLVQKSLLAERVKKYIKSIRPTMIDQIYEIMDRKVTADGEQVTMCFVTFSENGSQDEGVIEEVNIECMKEILWDFYTKEDNAPASKALFIDILPPKTSEDPHIMCFQEVDES